MVMSRRVGAEFLGTFWLVFGGCGSAVSAAAFPSTPFLGIGFVGVSFAFGLAVLTTAYAVGHISGGHFKPADVLPYWAARVAGAIAAAALLYVIASGREGFSLAGGHGGLSPGKYTMIACLVIEVLATFIILVAASAKAPAGFAPIPIGLGLTLIHHPTAITRVGAPSTPAPPAPRRRSGPG